MKWFVRTLVMLLALTALGGRADAQPKPAEQWTVYHNERFGFQLDYPAGLFKPDAPPENGDGLVFRNDELRASIRGSGGFNVVEWTVPTLRAEELKSRPGTVTSEQLGKNRLYLVGITKGEIFHLLVLLSNKSEVINTLEIRYPETSKNRLDAVAKRVVASFHAGHSEWYEHCCK